VKTEEAMQYRSRTKYPNLARAVNFWTVPALLAAYGFVPFSGPKPTAPTLIGIGELGGGVIASDMKSAFADLGLPLPNFDAVGVAGGSNNPGDGSGANGEVALDFQNAGASYSFFWGIAARLRGYFGQNAGGAMLACQQQSRADGCGVMSWSWGSSEANSDPTEMKALDAEFGFGIANGLTTLAASGDNDSGDGSPGANVDNPASSPNCIGCGGTTKTAAGETVWNNGQGEGTGGGYSTAFAVQPWQIGAPNGPGRMVPDVAAVADPNTGYPICVEGNKQVIGGTSAVAPLYAGIIAAFIDYCKLTGVPFPKNLLQWLWSHQSCFTDITVGNNGQWKAQSGPDPCTGLGVPNGANLLAAINGGTTTQPPPPPPPPAQNPVLRGSSVVLTLTQPTPVSGRILGGHEIPTGGTVTATVN
jgi:kumamolisin